MRIISFGIQRKIKAAEKMKQDAVVQDEIINMSSYLAKTPDKIGYFSKHFSNYNPGIHYQYSQRLTPAKNNEKRRSSFHGNTGQKTYRFRRFRIKV